MKRIEFSKLNGQGNDFVIINAVTEDVVLTNKEIEKICDRHFGVGADGVIFVRKSPKADFFMDYYNSDGSTAEMCGNGIRCVAKFAYDNGLTDKKSILIETRAGVKKINMEVSQSNEVGEIQADMGSPVFEPEKIPVNIDILKKSGQGSLKTVFNYKLSVEDKSFIINCVSMGNPHCVIFLKDNEQIDQIALCDLGPKIESHPFFPNKTNVEFIKIENEKEISMLVWERGSGETLACGTGACASAVAAIALGKVNSDTVKVNLKGGILNIKWNGNSDDSVFLKGVTLLNFKGEIFLN